MCFADAALVRKNYIFLGVRDGNRFQVETYNTSGLFRWQGCSLRPLEKLIVTKYDNNINICFQALFLGEVRPGQSPLYATLLSLWYNRMKLGMWLLEKMICMLTLFTAFTEIFDIPFQ